MARKHKIILVMMVIGAIPQFTLAAWAFALSSSGQGDAFRITCLKFSVAFFITGCITLGMLLMVSHAPRTERLSREENNERKGIKKKEHLFHYYEKRLQRYVLASQSRDQMRLERTVGTTCPWSLTVWFGTRQIAKVESGDHLILSVGVDLWCYDQRVQNDYERDGFLPLVEKIINSPQKLQILVVTKR